MRPSLFILFHDKILDDVNHPDGLHLTWHHLENQIDFLQLDATFVHKHF